MLDLSEQFVAVNQRDIPKVPALRGKVVASLFYEDSTRTRLSFETAAKRLSCDVMTFSVAQSSVKKGESLRDTVQTIAAMGIDAIVVRHPAAGAPHRIVDWIDASVINAGEGVGTVGDRLVYAAPQHGTLRKDLGLFTSSDGGATWRHERDLTANRSGYSDLVMLDAHRAGVLYETGLESGDARDTIVFQVAHLSGR